MDREVLNRKTNVEVLARVFYPWVRGQVERRGARKFYHVGLSSSEIAGVFLEEGVTDDIRRRINTADPMGTCGGVPQIRFDGEYNEHASAEREATFNSFRLAGRGCNLIVWISPEDGGGVYNEGRLNIQFATREKGEIVISGKGIPLLLDRFASVELAEKLIGLGGVTVGLADGVEGVRRQPIGFVLEDLGGGWIGKCREMMPEFGGLWDFFEERGEEENKRRMEKDVRVALAMASGDNYVFERIMVGMGHLINQTGNHGGSWLGAESGVGSFRMTMVGGLINVRVEPRADGKIVCPCGEVLKEGVSKCPKCGLVITAG